MSKRKYLSNKELAVLLDEARQRVPEGSGWRHFKGGDFRVERIVFDAEELQLEVVHTAIDNPDIAFTRSMTNWLETVEFQGFTLSRFEKMDDDLDD